MLYVTAISGFSCSALQNWCSEITYKIGSMISFSNFFWRQPCQLYEPKCEIKFWLLRGWFDWRCMLPSDGQYAHTSSWFSQFIGTEPISFDLSLLKHLRTKQAIISTKLADWIMKFTRIWVLYWANICTSILIKFLLKH